MTKKYTFSFSRLPFFPSPADKETTIKKKYILTEETKEINGEILHRIQSIHSFGSVKKGELGGYIASEENLSHEDEAWVGENACVFGNAKVSDQAKIFGNARVGGYAQIYDDAQVYGEAWVYGRICIWGNAQVYGNSILNGDGCVFGYAHIYGDASVYGEVYINGDADIQSNSDLFSITNIGSKNGYVTAFKSRTKGVEITRGCFHGTIEEFKESVKTTHQDNQMADEYLALIDYLEIRFKKFI